MIESNADDTTHLTLDPVLRRFSEQQLGVAHTWATHFCISPEERRQFIRDYLRATISPPVWAFTLEHEGVRIAVARFGNILQWFTGCTIYTRGSTIAARICGTSGQGRDTTSGLSVLRCASSAPHSIPRCCLQSVRFSVSHHSCTTGSPLVIRSVVCRHFVRNRSFCRC